MSVLRAVGLMSGTSLDGIDVAVLETDGNDIRAFGPAAVYPYDGSEVALLRRALDEARGLTDRRARPGTLAQAEAMVTRRHEAAVAAFLAANAIDRASIHVVGFHGQTVLHRPQQGLTVQIGDGSALARALGLPVIHDFRAADVAAGGQGAPLVPAYHRALVRRLGWSQPVAILNLGGVANVTFIKGGAEPLACDTGPGNALIDDFMAQRTGRRQDANGAAAAAGEVNRAVLDRLLQHPFFGKPLPKSLDRDDFARWVQPEMSALTTPDGAATLTAFTAAAVAAIVSKLPEPPQTWIAAGGGTHNRTMMRMLRERLAPAQLRGAQELDWMADALEAQAFAFLAIRSLKGLPISFPGTTGAPRPLTGGVLARP